MFMRLCKLAERLTHVKPTVAYGSRLYDFGNGETVQLRTSVFGAHIWAILQEDTMAKLTFTRHKYYLLVGKKQIMVEVSAKAGGKKCLKFHVRDLEADEMESALRALLGLFR